MTSADGLAILSHIPSALIVGGLAYLVARIGKAQAPGRAFKVVFFLWWGLAALFTLAT